MTIQENIFIEASPSEIFEYLTDINNRKSYVPALQDVIMLDPLPIKEGSRYIEVANIAGRNLSTTYQVINYEQDKRLTAKTLKSIFPIQADLDLKEGSGYTEFSITLDFQLSGIFKLASGIVSEIVRQQTRGILKKVKTNVEGPQV